MYVRPYRLHECNIQQLQKLLPTIQIVMEICIEWAPLHDHCPSVYICTYVWLLRVHLRTTPHTYPGMRPVQLMEQGTVTEILSSTSLQTNTGQGIHRQTVHGQEDTPAFTED